MNATNWGLGSETARNAVAQFRQAMAMQGLPAPKQASLAVFLPIKRWTEVSQ